MSDETRRQTPLGRQDDPSLPDYDPDQGGPLGEEDSRTLYQDEEPMAEIEGEWQQTPPSEGPGLSPDPTIPGEPWEQNPELLPGEVPR